MEYTKNDFQINQLGSFCSPIRTIIRVFAPESKTMDLVIGKQSFAMHKKGLTFEISLIGNQEGKKYHFVNDKGDSIRDPFAYYSDENDSYILNPKQFIQEKVATYSLTSPIIYEVNVRDFSCDDSFPYEIKRKFLSLVKSGLKKENYFMVGIDYLSNLGVNCVQLMPVFDFDKDKKDYNWGYNPKAFNYVMKDYVIDQKNPYAYINELRQTVNEFHRKNMKVILDVVFNHVYSDKTYDLGKLMPNHVYRYKNDGKLANGTFCGNELKSEDPFMRAYFKEMVLRYIRLFDIDGIRMDLMGILDTETVNEIYTSAKELKPSFMVYGEGWNMGDVLQESKRASLNNADQLRNVGMFNDFFRQTFIKAIVDEEINYHDIELALSGENNNLVPSQSINYVECHDNNTFFDRLMIFDKEDPWDLIINKSKLALAMVMLSRGIPFIHAGQEFLRTKALVENSYNSSEEINKMDWNRRDQYNEICDYFKDLCTLRSYFKLTNEVSFEQQGPILVYRNGDLEAYINFSKEVINYDFHSFHEIIFNENGLCNKMCENATIFPFSVIITKKN